MQNANSLNRGSGAHNNNEEEKGEERSVDRPCERLKFQNFLTVVTLLSLDVNDASQRRHNVLVVLCKVYSKIEENSRHSRVLE